jgi:hypothetical protein
MHAVDTSSDALYQTNETAVMIYTQAYTKRQAQNNQLEVKLYNVAFTVTKFSESCSASTLHHQTP